MAVIDLRQRMTNHNINISKHACKRFKERFGLNRKALKRTINKAFEEASKNHYKGILEYTEDPIVSVDIVGNTHSCIFDSQMTSVIGNMVKIIGWYDNETGYSKRIIDLLCFLSEKKCLLSIK